MDFETLAAGLNCTPPAIDDFPRDFFTEKERQDGAVVIHVLVSLYLFVALAVVCDKYFVPAVEKICHALNMSADVAGATFMAAATSAPELFVNVIGTFITEGDIGVGTIVGSAVFNILAVAACCGIGAGMCGVTEVPLDWWPLTRDCLAYGITVSILICIIHDERVEWYEALTLVLLYTVYILIMYFDKSIQKCARGGVKQARRYSGRSSSTKSKSDSIEAAEATLPLKFNRDKDNLAHENELSDQKQNSEMSVEPISLIMPPAHLNGSVKIPAGDSLEDTSLNKDATPTNDALPSNKDNTSGKDNRENIPNKENMPNNKDRVLPVKKFMPSKDSNQPFTLSSKDEEPHSLWKWPAGRGKFTQATWILTWPIHLVFMFTIPDCEKPRFKKWFPLTFMMCIVWIGSLSYVVAWMITIIGDTLKIPDSVMGITFLAAGTSVPEAVSSVIVAKQGHGSMGISNSIGSNTFDILLCLGLPWFIKATFMPTIPGKRWVGINSAGIEYSAISLLSSLLMLYVVFAVNKFKLDKRVGRICLLMYAVFLILASLIELNAFFRVNLPTCGR